MSNHMSNHLIKKQAGAASAILIVVIGGLLSVIFAVATILIGANNSANSFEQKIKAEHANNKNILGQYSQKIMEAAQVPTMMRDDVAKVTQAAIEGRYGADGSKAVFQMIKEQNPVLDSKVYLKLQTIIEAGRSEFTTAQTRLLDTKRAYETALGSIPKGMFMNLMGYPRINLAEFNIVTTDRTEQVFKTGREEAPLQLRAPAASN